ncbi:STAS domain-containing protein [Streptomyces sp. NEAU-H22]|uniref:STAS domain-containing protein n=1 Tax=unclassified Streptomyces TaxID=2593676 RepID=UPI00224CAA57|nr:MULTISPECIES: STAS domain-containing protein [unclassified Streptomyces]MCX3290591.1 STAS domain-containing protein [Streptomyces sp. NEAU-H22]WMD06754.1 STAS domain-containing protein [Streptomyces sp. FXY-T5]
MSDIPGTFAQSLPVETTHVVALRGELDLLAAPALRARLDVLTAGPCPDLVLDLRPVSFVDCSGLGVLCRARNRVRARHGRLRLVTGSASLRRVLRHAGMAGVFELLDRMPVSVAGAPATDTADSAAL